MQKLWMPVLHHVASAKLAEITTLHHIHFEEDSGGVGQKQQGNNNNNSNSNDNDSWW